MPGDYIQAHLEACKFVESIYGTPISGPADLVIATCGGYPKDINVYQLQKTMDNAWLAVREGGVVIILGECVEGVGDDLYLEWMKKYKTPERIEEEIRANFVVGGHKAYAVTRLMKKSPVHLGLRPGPGSVPDPAFHPGQGYEGSPRNRLRQVGAQTPDPADAPGEPDRTHPER